MREDEAIGVDERALDDAVLEALADAQATVPAPRLRARVLADARRHRQSELPVAGARRWRMVGALAAGVALVLGTIALRAARLADQRAIQVGALARANDELARRLDGQGRELAGLRDAVAGQGQVLRVLAGPHTLTAALVPKQGVGAGRVVVDPASGEGAIVLSGVEPAGPGRTYELWAIRGTRPPEPAGLFAVEAGRPLAAQLRTIPRPAEVTAFAVSLEPATGSPAPTGPIVLAGAVAG
jgi:hypothetical protein